MAMTAGQVCGERFKYSTSCYYIYQPTGAGDWYRWRLITRAQINTAGATVDDTYFCLAGCTRGKVYAGAQKLASQSDANSGWVSASTTRSVASLYTTTVTHYRDFNLPAGMTHVRPFLRSVSTYGDMRIEAYEDTTLLSSKDYDGYVDLDCCYEGDWFELPAGTTKVRVMKPVDDGKVSIFAGLDFINITSEVDPDSAGSVMYYTYDDPAATVLKPAFWGASLYPAPSTTELCIEWADTGGAYSGSKAVGGIGHQGINTATIAWATQSGTGAPATWTAAVGDKIAADYLIMSIVTAKAYQESAQTNWRGTLTGKLVFDGSGCVIDHQVAVNQLTNMDVFTMYIAQCTVPDTLTHTLFHGEESVRRFTGTEVAPQVKTPRIEAWGGPPATHYTIECLEIDTHAAYFQKVAASGLPRWVHGTGYYKAYMNYYYNTSAAMDLDNGSSIGTRFAIRLKDRKLTHKHIVRSF